MKRTALQRRTPLKRTPMRRKPRSTKYARRERDLDCMGWVKTCPCFMLQMEAWRQRREHPVGDRLMGLWMGPLQFGACRGVIEAHHAGEHGMSHKADDNTCIPLCEAHHRGANVGITDRRGPFAGWPRGAVKRWELAAVAHYQAKYIEHQQIERFIREAPPIW